MKLLKITLVVVALCGIALTSHARIIASGNQQNCKMVETATVGINFNNVPTDIKSAKSYTQEKADEVITIAKDLGIEDIIVQNMNYNVYSNNGGGCSGAVASQYNLNGNISFQIADAEKAANLMEAISEKGYKVNFNMNAYRQCQ